MKNSTVIIAEAGVNHNGSVKMARELVSRAKSAGADAIKFQTFKAERLLSRKASKAEYQKKTTSEGESQYEMIKKLELKEAEYRNIAEFCREMGIEFLSSPFDEESADLLEELGVSRFKIPSGEITNLPLLQHVASKGRPMLISTGMATMGEVEEALETVTSCGNADVVLLHCVTEYPAPFNEINLRAMISMRQAFNVRVGYSDHTPGLEVSIAAVALGAEMIEKHFTLSRAMEGPDHKASLEPEELGSLVVAIRNTESALGDGVKRPAPCELKNMDIARKSVVATRDIAEGEKLTTDNVAIKRPGSGIPPKHFGVVLGRKARCSVARDEVLTWEKLG